MAVAVAHVVQPRMPGIGLEVLEQHDVAERVAGEDLLAGGIPATDRVHGRFSHACAAPAGRSRSRR